MDVVISNAQIRQIRGTFIFSPCVYVYAVNARKVPRGADIAECPLNSSSGNNEECGDIEESGRRASGDRRPKEA
jgi:hypothetical protein